MLNTTAWLMKGTDQSRLDSLKTADASTDVTGCTQETGLDAMSTLLMSLLMFSLYLDPVSLQFHDTVYYAMSVLRRRGYHGDIQSFENLCRILGKLPGGEAGLGAACYEDEASTTKPR